VQLAPRSAASGVRISCAASAVIVLSRTSASRAGEQAVDIERRVRRLVKRRVESESDWSGVVA